MNKTRKKLIQVFLGFLAKSGEKAMQLARKHPIAAACVIVGLIPVTAAQPVAGAGLGALGFGTGVGAATVALGIQSGIGNVAAKSMFATLQSAGARGVGLAVVKAVVQALGVFGVVAAVVGGYIWPKK